MKNFLPRRVIVGPILITLLASMFKNSSAPLSNDSRASAEVLSRQKRYLIFPPGSVLQLGYCLDIKLLIPDGIWSYGITLGTNWELPSEPYNFFKHKAEAMHRRHRRELYNKLVPVLSMLGLDGKACILRALCEAGQRPRGSKGSFAEELLHSVFTLPRSKLEIDSEEEDEEDMTEFDNAHKTKRKCAEMFPSCSSSFVELTAF